VAAWPSIANRESRAVIRREGGPSRVTWEEQQERKAIYEHQVAKRTKSECRDDEAQHSTQQKHLEPDANPGRYVFPDRPRDKKRDHEQILVELHTEAQ
jgi:hypothetical protein